MSRRISVQFHNTTYEVHLTLSPTGKCQFSFVTDAAQTGLAPDATAEQILHTACKEIMLGLKGY